MADKFKVGDVVRLRSGGPQMTVVKLHPDLGEGEKVVCKWFSGSGSKKPESETYPPQALVLVTD